MEYVVSPDGVAGNVGSAASPWPLSKGIAALASGDVLLLRGGTYLERRGHEDCSRDLPGTIRSWCHRILSGNPSANFGRRRILQEGTKSVGADRRPLRRLSELESATVDNVPETAGPRVESPATGG